MSVNTTNAIQSGSTSDPKGCMVSQAALQENLNAISIAYKWVPGSLTASWVPHFHDMGLIGSLLLPIVVRIRIHTDVPFINLLLA